MPKHISPNRKKDGPFIRKDEHGRDIYFPWGYVGDAYYVSKEQKFTLKASCVLTAIMCVLLGLLVRPFPSSPPQGMIVIACNIAILCWLTFFYFYSKKLEPVKLQKSMITSEKSYPKLVGDLCKIFVALMFFIVWGFSKDQSDLLLKLCASFVLVVYPFLIWFVWSRQG
ncbi:MAG: hypothetical protein KKA05_09960, partial [Alphaproteobacteria bacterium]|nr:hypothetical protein [Alphaproteobacteria bacterium]